jgi:hypothetical protein
MPERTSYMLPEGALEVEALAELFYLISNDIPDIVSSRAQMLNAFLAFA